MTPSFYQRNAKTILILIGTTLALVWNIADSIPSNNNTESWISTEDVDRSTYDDFRHHFGGEEIILIGLARNSHSPDFVESLAARLEQLSEIRRVWTPDRLTKMMGRFTIPAEEIESRLRRIAVSRDGELMGVAAILTHEGLQDRTLTTRRVNEVLNLFELDESQVKLTGAPIIVAELDRLGGKEANRQYFIATIVICFAILWYMLKRPEAAGLIVLEIVWAFQMTLAIVHVCGGQMNFILDSLPVLVMVFAMAIALHYIYHAANHIGDPDGVRKTLQSVAWPCFLAMFTTAVGLLSLATNEIPPVVQFGLATAGGTLVAFVAGLFVTPAVLEKYPPVGLREARQNWEQYFQSLADRLTRHRAAVAAGIGVFLLLGAWGFRGFTAEFQPLNFFPEDSKVLADTHEIRERIANTDSVEVVVDFGAQELPAGEQIDIIRDIEAELLSCDRVPVVVSGISWLPKQVTPEHLSELNRFRTDPTASEFVADNGNMWRLSARIEPDDQQTQQQIFAAISQHMNAVGQEKGLVIRTTGIAPLIEKAQEDIFNGFWTSVGSAMAVISTIMIITLYLMGQGVPRSLGIGLLAMIPNVTPLLIVFGAMGWFGIPTNIGTMMTGSIALGIAVDGTFHFLTRYCQAMNQSGRNIEATRQALIETGPPIVQATCVTGVGMLALVFSNFGPTGSFGLLMSISLAVALVGDLVFLPCLLMLFARDRSIESDLNQTAISQLNSREHKALSAAKELETVLEEQANHDGSEQLAETILEEVTARTDNDLGFDPNETLDEATFDFDDPEQVERAGEETVMDSGDTLTEGDLLPNIEFGDATSSRVEQPHGDVPKNHLKNARHHSTWQKDDAGNVVDGRK